MREGRQIKQVEDQRRIPKKENHKQMRTSKCFATDGSKVETKPFIGFVTLDISDGISWKFRAHIKREALAIGETLQIIDRTDSQQNFMIFSDSESLLTGISDLYNEQHIAHIRLMLKDKIERLEQG
jgi:hypothetical protein